MTDQKGKKSWANVQKEATNVVPLTKGEGSKLERFEGTIDSVTAKVFKTGSFGFVIRYKLPGNEGLTGAMKYMYDNIVITKADGTETTYGKSSLIKRYQAAGAPSDFINGLTIPTNANDVPEGFGGEIVGADVVIKAQKRLYLGKPQFDVKAVFPLDRKFE